MTWEQYAFHQAAQQQMLKANSEAAAAAFAAQSYGQQLQDPSMWAAEGASPNTAAKTTSTNGTSRPLSLQERLQEDFPSGDGIASNNSQGGVSNGRVSFLLKVSSFPH